MMLFSYHFDNIMYLYLTHNRVMAQSMPQRVYEPFSARIQAWTILLITNILHQIRSRQSFLAAAAVDHKFGLKLEARHRRLIFRFS